MDILKNIQFKYVTSDFVKSEGKEARVIEGYASTYDIDRQFEVITPEAMKNAVKNLLTTNTTIFYEHQHQNNPIGRILEARVDEKGLFIKALISETATNVWTLIKEGILNKFSIGGKVKNYHKKFDKDLGKDITYVTDMELYEISVVGLPANENASFKAKSLKEAIVKALEVDGDSKDTIQIIEEGGVKVEKKEKDASKEAKKEDVKKEEIKKSEPVKDEAKKEETKKEVKKSEEPKTELTKEEIEYVVSTLKKIIHG